MSKTTTERELLSRRAELLAELFLQDLGPEFVARPTADFGYDFFAGFPNPRGGVNIVAVEVKATEARSTDFFMVPMTKYARWVNSNIPVLLLVINTKENVHQFAWPDLEVLNHPQRSQAVKVPLSKVDNNARSKLREQLTA